MNERQEQEIISRFSPIFYCNRQEAILQAGDRYPYVVYFDKDEEIYPQLKFIAINEGEEYLEMDVFFEVLMLEDKQYIAIHDTYSNYQTFNFQTYAMPLTYKNLDFFQKLVHKEQLNVFIDEFKQRYIDSIISTVKQLKTWSSTKRKMKNNKTLSKEERARNIEELEREITSLIESKFTLSRYAHFGREKVKTIETFYPSSTEEADPFYDLDPEDLSTLENVQHSISRDTTAIFFVNDNYHFIVNDVLLAAIADLKSSKAEFTEDEIIEALDVVLGSVSQIEQDKLNRYMEIRNALRSAKTKESRQAREQAAEEVVSSQQIRLFAVSPDIGTPQTIFSAYRTWAIQCKNQPYASLLKDTEFFKTYLSDLLTLPITAPTQDTLFKQLDCSGRWNPFFNGVERQLFDPNHLGWQSELHYKQLDETERTLLEKLGYKFIPGIQQVLCLPFPNYILHIFCYNIEKLTNNSTDAKNIALEAQKYLDESLGEGKIHAIPEHLIKQLEPYLEADKIADYRKINSEYYQDKVLPLLLKESLQHMEKALRQISRRPDSATSKISCHVFNSSLLAFEIKELDIEQLTSQVGELTSQVAELTSQVDNPAVDAAAVSKPYTLNEQLKLFKSSSDLTEENQSNEPLNRGGMRKG